MGKSQALRLLIGTIIATGSVTAFKASADYCTSTSCFVTHAWFVPLLYGGGGGGAGGTDNTDQTDPLTTRDGACNEMWATMPEGCNYISPPPLVQNGCGASGGAPIPDFLVSPVAPAAAASFGDIFTAACNKHDVCYGTSKYAKAHCDAQLQVDMIAAGQTLPGDFPAVFASDIANQAYAYSHGLQFFLVEGFASGPAYESAQSEAACRDLSGVAYSYQCYWPGIGW
jgi:hypothetical protein